MKKRKIFTTAILAGLLMVCGCQTQNQKGLETDGLEVVESQETSAVAGTLSENTVEEEKADFEELEPEIMVEGNNGTIRIGTSGTPYTELLTQVKKTTGKKRMGPADRNLFRI